MEKKEACRKLTALVGKIEELPAEAGGEIQGQRQGEIGVIDGQGGEIVGVGHRGL